MACRAARSLLLLRDELNITRPGRSTASDGFCPSAAHHQANPSSDHEPNRAGIARAFDITHDPRHGMDGDDTAAMLMLDPRTKYLIWNRRIWYPTAGARPRGWSPYHGSSPHIEHVHLSIYDWAVADMRPWPLTITPPKEQPVTEAQANEIIGLLKAITAKLETGKADGKKLPEIGALVAADEAAGRRRGVDLGAIKQHLGID